MCPIAAFSCIKIGRGLYVASAPEVECAGAQYTSWIAFLIVLLVILTVGIFALLPIYILRKLRAGAFKVRD